MYYTRNIYNKAGTKIRYLSIFIYIFFIILNSTHLSNAVPLLDVKQFDTWNCNCNSVDLEDKKKVKNGNIETDVAVATLTYSKIFITTKKNGGEVIAVAKVNDELAANSEPIILTKPLEQTPSNVTEHTPTSANAITLTEEQAKAKLILAESETKDAHYVKKHGADIPMEDILQRAQTGKLPEGRKTRPTNASKFDSNQIQLSAKEKAIQKYNNGEVNNDTVKFDMETTIGRGYLKGAGLNGQPAEIITTSKITAYFNKKGDLITIFPDITQ